MFTGIVEGMGLVLKAAHGSGEGRFAIRPLFAMPNMADGESIAVNGVCLSVERHSAKEFTAYASAETMARTNLRGLAPGDKPNLERALALGARLGGHMVSGHVDCVATVAQIDRRGQSLHVRVAFARAYGGQVVSKGSVALNGISLTVNDCGDDFLDVNVIPESQKRTNLPAWRQGTQINMETDIIGKYVQHLLAPYFPDQAAARINMDFLAMHGFL